MEEGNFVGGSGLATKVMLEKRFSRKRSLPSQSNKSHYITTTDNITFFEGIILWQKNNVV